MTILLDSKAIEAAIEDLAKHIASDLTPETDVAIIGIRSRGENLAQRLHEHLCRKIGRDCPCGILDITLYRDDLDAPHSRGLPNVQTTEITFDITDKTIILVDDVLYTGRSVRAALDALIDLGRPHVIRLAVLIERQGREFPIQPDYLARHVDVEKDKKVKVCFTETDGIDQVAIG